MNIFEHVTGCAFLLIVFVNCRQIPPVVMFIEDRMNG